MNGTRGHWTPLAAALSLCLAATLLGDDFRIDWWTVDNGGAVRSVAADFELSGTIGQPDAGVMTGGAFEVTGGFWLAIRPGDCNADGSVGLVDYDSLEPCLLGPDVGGTPNCRCFDLDSDSDIDLSDVALFQRTFDGL